MEEVSNFTSMNSSVFESPSLHQIDFTTATTTTYTISNSNYTNPTSGNMAAVQTIPSLVMTTIFIFNGILATIGIAGNVVVCLIIVRGRKMYTIANLFLMNLAIADMCVLVVSYPLWVLQTVAPTSWPFGAALCKIIPSVSDAFYGVSLGCMTAISIHRYRMIIHAVGKQLTFVHAKLIMVTIWVVSLASISAPLFPVVHYNSNSVKVGQTINTNTVYNHSGYDDDFTDITTQHVTCRSKWPSRSYERSYQFFLFVFWYVCPLLIILFTFVRIKVYLEKQMKYDWLKGSEHTLLVANHITGIRKALRMLAPVVIVFAILMLPWNIIRMVSFFTQYHLVDDIQIYIVISGTMLVANSVSNPFIYYIKSREFRIEFQKQFWLLKVNLGILRVVERTVNGDDDGACYDNNRAEGARFVIDTDHHGRTVVRRADSFLIENACHQNYRCQRSLTVTSDVMSPPSTVTASRREEMLSERFAQFYGRSGSGIGEGYLQDENDTYSPVLGKLTFSMIECCFFYIFVDYVSMIHQSMLSHIF